MKILVTAGPTREAIDPVRFLSNRSSGKMGYAIAEAALNLGHEVRLVSGPVSLRAPKGLKLTPVISAADMLDAVLADFDWCDALIMCAAVADWRPKTIAAQKLKKSASADAMTLELERTDDILKKIAPFKQNRIVVGFAAETQNILKEARRKLKTKNLDLIAANDVSRSDAGFGVDTNAVTLITADSEETLPLMSKQAVAEHLIKRLEEISSPDITAAACDKSVDYPGQSSRMFFQH